MAENGNINWLVSTLSLEERQRLLKKLNDSSKLPNKSLWAEKDYNFSAFSSEARFSNLAWYRRLLYFFMGFLKNKHPKQLSLEFEIAKLGKKIEKKFPGLYNHKLGMLMPAFHQQLQRLKDAAQFFYSALGASVNRDRDAFFAFLGSLEMPDIHNQLEAETDPDFVAKKYPNMTVSECRQISIKNMDDLMNAIPGECRIAMYVSTRSIFCLKELSSFSYDRILGSFTMNRSAKGLTCHVGVVKDFLASLNNILLSIKVVPSMALLGSIFIFILQKADKQPGFNMEKELGLLLQKAEESLAVIRDFNKQVPVTQILRCQSGEAPFTPKEISGGEDWFLVYRDYWKRQAERFFNNYMKGCRRQELQVTLDKFLKGEALKPIENAQSPNNPGGIPVRETFALSFLYTFHLAVFKPLIDQFLYAIFINGKFRREEDRVEFSENYSALTKLEDEIKKFEYNISTLGEYGSRYDKILGDSIPPSAKSRKMQSIEIKIQKEAEGIIKRQKRVLQNMLSTVNKIIAKDARGRPDILNNIEYFTGKDNVFILGLENSCGQLREAITILNDIETIENGK